VLVAVGEEKGMTRSDVTDAPKVSDTRNPDIAEIAQDIVGETTEVKVKSALEIVISPRMMTEQSWNDLVRKRAVASGTFMHSWAWGEFQQTQGREVRRYLLLTKEGVEVCIAQAIKSMRRSASDTGSCQRTARRCVAGIYASGTCQRTRGVDYIAPNRKRDYRDRSPQKKCTQKRRASSI
jgi:hypothetical protein